jgi:hypothetical protein
MCTLENYVSFLIKINIINMNNKKLIKVLNTTKDTSEWYNISRKAINTYIRSGKL